MDRGRNAKGSRVRLGRTGFDLDSRNMVRLLRAFFNARRSGYTVEVYDTTKGYHMRIKHQWPPDKTIRIQQMLSSDPNRVHFDEIRYERGNYAAADLLFDHERDIAVDPLSPPWWEGPR